MQNFHTVGNTNIGTYPSAIHCLQRCFEISATGCAGVDFDKRDNSCWMATRQNACEAAPVVDNCCDRLTLPFGCSTLPGMFRSRMICEYILNSSVYDRGKIMIKISRGCQLWVRFTYANDLIV